MPCGSGGNNMARRRLCVLCSLVFSCRLKWRVCTRSEHGSKLLYPLFPLSCQSARRHSAPGSAGLLYNSSTLTHSTDLSPHAEIEATQLLTFPGLYILPPMMPHCCAGPLHPANQPLVVHFLHCFTRVLYLVTYSDRFPCYFEDYISPCCYVVAIWCPALSGSVATQPPPPGQAFVNCASFKIYYMWNRN